MPRTKKLALVREHQAEGRTGEIYSEIKQALGVPHVNVIFQAYAAYPAFLELQWRALKPILETQEFFAFAERLRADAYTRMCNYFRIPDFTAGLRSSGTKELAELANVVELFHYNNPPLLLIAAAQLQAFDSSLEQVPRVRAVSTPAAHPVFTEKPALVEEAVASAAIRRIYDDIKRTFGLPFVNTDYRAFARWPDFLQLYWSVLKPLTQSPVYAESQHGIRETAVTLARELPQRFELGATKLADKGISEDDIAAVLRITELFVKLLSGLVLNVALAKIGWEGGSDAGATIKNLGEDERLFPERAA